jgi:predicted transport protein
LHKLENEHRRERVDIKNYTIEHIMPQNANLPAAWKHELGEGWKQVHARYLHTIGNLTLTGYNPELSDRSFAQKRDMEGGFADSPIRLNRGLAKLERWTEDEIRQRADTLAHQAVAIWPAPQMAAETLEKYLKDSATSSDPVYTLDDHRHLCGDMRQLFDQLRRRILNLDASVSEQILMVYIAYKNGANFVDIVPQKSRLLLSLNMAFAEVNDPRGWCKDVATVGRSGNGDVEFGVSSPDELDYAMSLVHQSFEKHGEDPDGCLPHIQDEAVSCGVG